MEAFVSVGLGGRGGWGDLGRRRGSCCDRWCWRRVSMVISKETRNSRAAGEGEGGGEVVRLRMEMTRMERKQQVRKWFAAARAAERDGEVEKAEDLLRMCLQMDERDGHSWLALARIRSRRDLSAARNTFVEAMKKCPRNVHLLQALGVLEHRAGNVDKARELFRNGLELEPDNPYVCQAWGLLEQRCGKTEAARELYRRVVELRPQSEVCAAWATLESGDGNAEKARELFTLGLEYVWGGPCNRVVFLNTWAEAEERLGNVPRARELLNCALEELATPETRMSLAKLEARDGSLQKALELMRSLSSSREKIPAFVYNGWACLEMQANATDNARKLLKKGHDLYPMDAALLQTWGTLEERNGAFERAKELYNRSVEVRATAVALVAWACLEARQGGTQRARELFAKALRVDPLHGAAYNAFAKLELNEGNLEKARSIYERGLEHNPSASVLLGYAQLEMKYGRRKEKVRELFRLGVSQTRGDSSFIWHAWLMLELRERDPRAARKIAAEARKRYARNSRLLVASALAEAAWAPGVPANIENSRKYFREAVLVDPRHAHAWQAWGVREFREGNGEVAKSLFRKGLNLCPTHGSLWQAWGVLEAVEGNLSVAEELFREGVKKCPNHVQIYQAWACMEVKRGEFGVARDLLETALRSDPTHGPVWTAYGLLESRYGKVEKARELFVLGLRHAPNHGPLYRTYATMEERLGNHERARTLLHEGLRRDPFDAPSYKVLALLEKKLGQPDAFKALALQARDIFGVGNVKSVLLDGHCAGWSTVTEEDDELSLYHLWSMEKALDMPSKGETNSAEWEE